MKLVATPGTTWEVVSDEGLALGYIVTRLVGTTNGPFVTVYVGRARAVAPWTYLETKQCSTLDRAATELVAGRVS